MPTTWNTILELNRKNEVRISAHGYDEMADDNLTVDDILDSVSEAQLVEDYPEYPKGPCCLMLQCDQNNQPIHTVWGIPKDKSSPAVLVTAYRPDPALWNETFTERSS